VFIFTHDTKEASNGLVTLVCWMDYRWCRRHGKPISVSVREITSLAKLLVFGCTVLLTHTEITGFTVYIMNTYGGTGTIPTILNVGTRWRLVLSFTSRPFNNLRKNPS
jgi:hypothetical protein